MAKADLIAAIATPPGKGAIGIVRLSGPSLGHLFEPLLGHEAAPRTAVLANFRDGHGRTIDQGLAIYFPGPHSYTGEDVLELQGHGGRAVLQAVLRRCLELGARLAEPGEFTRRAFLNDKLDLVQAESVADLVEASSAAAARSAVRSLTGEFSNAINRLVEQLIHLRLLAEASIDFPEEGTDHLDETSSLSEVGQLLDRVREVITMAAQGRLLREGAQVVLIGRPNVGKSSLLNRLAGEEVAIVTDIPGTTRDVIRLELSIGGVPMHVMDTAGLREAADPVEVLGVARTRDALRKADLALVIADVRDGLTSADRRILAELPARMPRILVYNKIDLAPSGSVPQAQDTGDRVYVSALSGEGLSDLQGAILRAVGWLNEEEPIFLARERHLQALERAAQHLETAQGCAQTIELFAEELRLGQLALGEITGEFTADDLLGEIFSRFCIGK
jgi:tRNA modification GTPase